LCNNPKSSRRLAKGLGDVGDQGLVSSLGRFWMITLPRLVTALHQRGHVRSPKLYRLYVVQRQLLYRPVMGLRLREAKTQRKSYPALFCIQ
jgi:hypothetical protein